MPARDGAQAEERDAELAVAELPPGRGICLVVLVKGVAHLDAAGPEGGKEAFQVIDSVLNLNLTHQAASPLASVASLAAVRRTALADAPTVTVPL